MNYYRRYVGDYLRDTSRLSMLEHGAYNLLLDYYYAEERPIPVDLDEVYRMVRAIMPEERRAVQKVLTTFFTRTDEGYRHKRVDEEIAKGSIAIEQMSDAGREGAAKRWGKRRGADAGGDAGADRVPHRKTAKTDGVVDAGGDATTNHQPPSSNRQPPTTSEAIAPSGFALDAPGPRLVEEIVERIPLCDGSEFDVPKSMRDELDRLYPAVDPDQTLREIRGWNLAKPKRRKTRRGIKAHIFDWFAREQDKQSRRAA